MTTASWEFRAFGTSEKTWPYALPSHFFAHWLAW